MKTATKCAVVAATIVAAVWAAPGMAQVISGDPGDRCGPAGAWFGQNETFGLEFLVTIVPIGNGCFSVVTETYEITEPYEYGTLWRGVIRRVDLRTYSWTQLSYAGPSQVPGTREDVPDIAAARGQMTMVDCDHFEIDFDKIAIYAWGQKPFASHALMTFPPSHASYTRVPGTCQEQSTEN